MNNKNFIVNSYRTNTKKSKRGEFKNTTKEERAKALDNIICPRCKYQNHKQFVQKYGKCNLCGVTLDRDYFKKMLLRELKN